MKKVNFISSLSPQKQYAIQRWFWFTAAVWLVSIAIGAYCVVPQLLTYMSLKKEVVTLREKTKNYAENLKNKDTLKNEHELLSTQLNKIKKYNERPTNPYQHIAVFIEAAGSGVKLESLKCNKKDCECTILCPTAEHATVVMRRLSLSDLLAELKLVSLQHDTHTKQFRAVIKGNIVT